MQIDLYLPCIPFQVSVRPGDSSRPTDLECAALHFIDETEDKRADNARQLERFLSLGSAVFQDLLIRMVNRCWVLLESRENGAVLRLSDAARIALRNDSFTGMGALEQGRSFTVCYDLLGGGLASIPQRFRSKAMAESAALQPVRGRKSEALYKAMPYRKALNGFLVARGSTADPFSARLLQALQSDRGARGYLRDQGGIAPALRVAPPGKMLSWNDVEFYRCRFNVYHSGTETDDGLPIPVLECTEQRNATARKLGQANAQAIVEDALAGTDTRLICLLRRSMKQDTVFQRSHSNPIEAMLDLVKQQDNCDLAELKECWDVARERVHAISCSRLDLVAPVDLAGIREAVAEMARKPGARLLVASPFIRSSSPELSVDPNSLLSTLTEGAAVPLIHGAKGANARGSAISDQTAIARLVTALPAAKFHVEDQSLDHVRTPFVADDGGGFLWLADSPFGDRGPGSGLRLDFSSGCGAHGFAQLVHALPWSQQDWIEEVQASQPVKAGLAMPLPDWLAARTREVDAAFEVLGEAKWADPEDRQIVLEDLARQITAIDSWIRLESNSVEFLAGAEIQARAAVMFGPRGDRQALALGLSGRNDLRFLADVTDQVCARLSRQDLVGIDNAPLHVFLPDDLEAAPEVELFERRVGQSGTRHRVVTQPLPQGLSRPPSFVLAPATALVAHDGIVRFVPTIGRKIKGLQLAVQLQGCQMEREVAQFIVAQWPAAAEALTAICSTETVTDPGLSRQHRKRLIETAHMDRWFDDGNVGATTIIRANRDTGSPAAWDDCFDLGVKLLAPVKLEERDCVASERLGYAHLKAVADAVEEAPELAQAARTRMAQRAADTGDLLVASILADHLPDGTALRDPQARKLAYALARQLPPHLTADDELALTAPTAPVACLSCALMLDGLGEKLTDILRNCDLGGLGSEAGVAQALARYLHDHDLTSIEVLGLEPGDSSEDIDQVVKEIVSRINSAAQRPVGGLPPQVLALRDEMFGTPGAFAFELRTFFDKVWPDLGPSARGSALSRIMTSVSGDLDLDLYASVSNNAEVRISRIAQAYFDRKNEALRLRPGDELVDLTKAGKFMPATIVFVLEKLVGKVIPALIKASDNTAKNLAEAILAFESAASNHIPPQVQVLRKLLVARLDGPDARATYVSPAWRFPTLPTSIRPDWPALAKAMLAYEFEGNSDFAEVMDWFLEQDRASDARSGTRSDAYLSRVIDLLEAAKGSIDATARSRVTERLGRHLRDMASTIDKDAAAARTFEIASGVIEGKLTRSARELGEMRRAMDEALAAGDLLAAILGAEDLHSYHRSLIADWRAATSRTLEELAEGQGARMAGELSRLLSDRGIASKLAEAKAYLTLRPQLARRIELDADFQLEIGDGRVPSDTPADTQPLMDILAKVRRSDLGALEDGEVLSQAITAFLSGLAPTELLARAVCSNDVWQISSAHSSFKALALLHDNAELLVAKSRDAEIGIRTRWQPAVQSAKAGYDLGVSSLSSSVGSTQDHPVLVSLFISQPAVNATMLPWRLLALLARESTRNRRIAVLCELSRQTFGGSDGIRRWWREMDGPSRLAALVALVELPADWHEERTHLAKLIGLTGDACLALGLFVAADPDAIQLSETGCRAIAAAWNDHSDLVNLEREVEAELLLKIMDVVIDAGAR